MCETKTLADLPVGIVAVGSGSDSIFCYWRDLTGRVVGFRRSGGTPFGLDLSPEKVKIGCIIGGPIELLLSDKEKVVMCETNKKADGGDAEDMKLRDYFAGQALVGIACSLDGYRHIALVDKVGVADLLRELANMSFTVADMMLEARGEST